MSSSSLLDSYNSASGSYSAGSALKHGSVVSNDNITLSGTTDLYADFYAPTSTILITSNSDLYGSVIANNLTISGNGGLHYDEALPSPNASVQGGLSLVR